LANAISRSRQTALTYAIKFSSAVGEKTVYRHF
jgi:hypothetical protein